jgi:hypothetical protein
MFPALPCLQKLRPNFCLWTDIKSQASSLILFAFLFFSHPAWAQKSTATNEDQIQAVIVLARHVIPDGSGLVTPERDGHFTGGKTIAMGQVDP